MWERIRAVVLENLNLKLISFAFALVMYSLVHGGQEERRLMSVDLNATPPREDSDFFLVSTIPLQVRVNFRGSTAAIDKLQANTVSVLIDLSTAHPERVTFNAKMVRLPEGVNAEVMSFDPPYLDLRWEPRIVRDVPLEVSVVSSPAPGYVVKGPPVAEPTSAKVRGPQSEVVVLQHIRAEAFDVHGLTEGAYPRQLALEKPSPRVSIDPQRAIVTAEITRETAERVFQKLPVSVVGTPKGRTTPGEVDVRLVCPPDIVRGLRPEQIVPQVEVTSKDPSGSQSLAVHVRMDKCDAYVVPREVVARW